MHSRTRVKQQGANASSLQTQASIKSHHGAQSSGFSPMRLLLICVSALALTFLCSIMNTTGPVRNTRINQEEILPATNIHVDETSISNDLEQQTPPVVEDKAIEEPEAEVVKKEEAVKEDHQPVKKESVAVEAMEEDHVEAIKEPEAVEEDHQPVERESVAVEEIKDEKKEPEAVEEDHQPVEMEAVKDLETPAEIDRGMEAVNEKHHIVSGFPAAMKYLDSYNQSKPIFILLMCDKSVDSGLHWSPSCSSAESTVYATLRSTTLDLMILEVRVGSEDDWTKARSEFRSDRRFKVKHMPALIRWEGHDRSSDYLGGEQVADAELLMYMLDGKQHIDAEPVLRDIPEISTHEDMEKILEKYDGSHPLFFFLISGRLPDVNRSWCPYCRLAEIPVEYHYLKYAPQETKLVKIKVASTYGAWRSPGNPFKVDTRLNTRGVPALLKVTRTVEGEFTFKRYPESLIDLPGLIELFKSSADKVAVREAPEI